MSSSNSLNDMSEVRPEILDPIDDTYRSQALIVYSSISVLLKLINECSHKHSNVHNNVRLLYDIKKGRVLNELDSIKIRLGSVLTGNSESVQAAVTTIEECVSLFNNKYKVIEDSNVDEIYRFLNPYHKNPEVDPLSSEDERRNAETKKLYENLLVERIELETANDLASTLISILPNESIKKGDIFQDYHVNDAFINRLLQKRKSNEGVNEETRVSTMRHLKLEEFLIKKGSPKRLMNSSLEYKTMMLLIERLIISSRVNKLELSLLEFRNKKEADEE